MFNPVKAARKLAATYWHKEYLYYHELYLKAKDNDPKASEYFDRYIVAKYKYDKYSQ